MTKKTAPTVEPVALDQTVPYYLVREDDNYKCFARVETGGYVRVSTFYSPGDHVPFNAPIVALADLFPEAA